MHAIIWPDAIIDWAGRMAPSLMRLIVREKDASPLLVSRSAAVTGLSGQAERRVNQMNINQERVA